MWSELPPDFPAFSVCALAWGSSVMLLVYVDLNLKYLRQKNSPETACTPSSIAICGKAFCRTPRPYICTTETLTHLIFNSKD